MVQNTFQQYESLTMEGCVFQFFNLLSKYHAFDVERFTNCAVGVRKEGVREECVREEGVREECVREECVREEGVREEGVREEGVRKE